MPDKSKVYIVVAAITILTLLLRIVNLKRVHRGRQILSVYLSPIIAFALSFAAYYYFSKISFDLIRTFYGAEVFVWNGIVVLAYLLIKLLMCPIMKAAWKKNSTMEATVDRWYAYDMYEEQWFLKARYRNLRTVWKASMVVIAAACAAALAFIWIKGPESEYWFKVFPVVALICVTEIVNFLSGYTKKEYARNIGGESISASKIGGYHKLRKVYEEVFPIPLLVSHTGNEFTGKQSSRNLIVSYSESDDPVKHVVGEYFSRLHKKISSFDVDLVSVTATLLSGESAVIFNPFYRDLDDYLLLPLVNSLINNKNCLIVVGRESQKEDVSEWADGILKRYSKTRSLWRTRSLTKDKPNCEVGVLSFSQLYDLSILKANGDFFKKTGFFLIVEPSKMITTSQTGLSIIVEKFNKADPPTCCVIDHETDGLVDTLSHVLQKNLTTVAAAPIPRSTYTVMGWAASGEFDRQRLFDKQTHYLGNGVEIAAVALKNQVPHVTWYSAEKTPVQDVKWIAGQYFSQICKFAHLPSQQKALEERLEFSSNYWGSSSQKEEFVIAEDEFCNLFATMRAFLTRGEKQSFVNVISENYMLRDYMRYNKQMFMSDPKVIPAIAPHYSKTERNTVIRLIMMMVEAPVDEEYIQHELTILGRDTEDVFQTLSNLIRYYTFVDSIIISSQNLQELNAEMVPIQVCRYTIPQSVFDLCFADTLKNAFIVVEDEKLGVDYLDARLFEHLTQIVMPGQLVVYNGKLYKVNMVSPQVGCVLHRAADSYSQRFYYRQLRTYDLYGEPEVVRLRRFMDIEIAFERRSFSVTSEGYLIMDDNNDLRSAKTVDLSDDPSVVNYRRNYKNKSTLRISLPDTDADIRFTISLLLNELFRTLFPDSWPYIAVLTVGKENVEGILKQYAYGLEGIVDEDALYVIEDSDMDLGLLEAVDDNIQRIFEILSDFLRWHFEKMREPAFEDPLPQEVQLPEEKEKEKFLKRLFAILGRLAKRGDDEQEPGQEPKPEKSKKRRGREKEKDPETQTGENEGTEAFSEPEEAEPALKSVEGTTAAELSEGFDPDAPEPALSSPEAEEAPAPEASEQEAEEQEQDVLPEEEQIVLQGDDDSFFAHDGVADDLDLLMPITPTRYQKECFLKYGFEEIDSRLMLDKVKTYLSSHGWAENALTRARRPFDPRQLKIDLKAENHCDFCGMPLSGVSYERLSDGRVRCNDCALTSIDEKEEFVELFKRTEIMMENVFNISIRVSVTVKTADARTIAKLSGHVFTPSTEVDARVLGFAQRKRGKYSLYVENGSPRLAAIDTICHELTHIWQYVNWDEKQIDKLYPGDKLKDIVYEGMALWASIQMLYSLGETTYANQQELLVEARDDVYGQGFRLFRERYNLVRDEGDVIISPFTTFPPL